MQRAQAWTIWNSVSIQWGNNVEVGHGSVSGGVD